MTDFYESPLAGRYAGEEMRRLFSDDFKFTTWRRLWIALAEAERELGLDITEEQIAEMRARVSDINYAAANAAERELRHDVMAHIRAFGEQCPAARPIIHLGATSCYVGDNTDIIRMKEGLAIIRRQVVAAVRALAAFAGKYKSLACLAYTHFQPAQPTTMGKRACLWIADLLMDLERLEQVSDSLALLGCKGTTGTGASFLSLFGGDADKAERLERVIAEKMGFGKCYAVSGQTYSRKVDYAVLSVLSGLAQSAHKFSNDIRLLSHLKAVDEPFTSQQVGSSAMAYKRNPMRSERMASLARFVIVDAQNAALTASEQWFERTLDDSANKRLAVSECFLAADAVLTLYINVIEGLTVYPKVLEKQLEAELPFMATENILMYCVKKGGDRQTLHEAIRRHSVSAGQAVKRDGADNDLTRRILTDPVFNLTEAELSGILSAGGFTGMAERQTERYLNETVYETINRYGGEPGFSAEVSV